MSLLQLASSKKFAVGLGVLAVALLVLAFRRARAGGGPVLENVNPQGTVTNSSSIKITLDTNDLAQCRFSDKDESYSAMSEEMYSPDGLEHTGTIGSLAKGSYVYYVRCQDFEGNTNSESTQVKFTVGDVSCVGSGCSTTTGGVGPVISNFLPSGTVYSKYVVLAATTDKAASCRYSWLDKEYDAMTLSFSSSNKLYHTASATLAGGGNYVCYVRCKDEAGNVNSSAGRIQFYYYVAPTTYVAPITTTTTTTTKPADTSAPVISALLPAGQVAAKNKKTEISCATDEPAHCRFGTVDADYDSLTDKFDVPGSIVSLDPSGTSHTKTVDLGEPGNYTYYVRCEDDKGNKNTVSSKIEFEYILPEGPKISDLQPNGVIYESDVALFVSTDKTATCRFSEEDIDYDDMGDSFDTNDGSLHQATVNLDDYGSYVYYVRCADNDGNKNDKSETISFDYENPNPPAECENTVSGEKDDSCDNANDCICDPDCPTEGDKVDADCANLPKVQESITCAEIKDGSQDGVCDTTNDCVCDLDCPASGADADIDCANRKTSSGGGGWIALILIGLILLIIVAIVIVIMRRRGSEEEDVELP
jgi:hypothetical protein